MRRPPRPALFVAGVLLLSLVLGGGVPARAQLVATPESLAVTLEQSEVAERVLTLANTGSEAVSFCLSFERPLQRVGAGLRLSEAAAGDACGPLGEVLFEADDDDVGSLWIPYGLTMTPEGRLFVAENRFVFSQTFEFDTGLNPIRSFEHPVVEELGSLTRARGVTYNPDTGTLWWLNIEEERGLTLRALLLEGSLDGVATGRRIEVPVRHDAPPPDDVVGPQGASYDPATRLYYYIDGFSDTLWAVDSTGTVAEGYPVEQTAYPGTESVGGGVDAHGGMRADGSAGEPEAVRLEFGIIPPGTPGPTGVKRIVVTDRWGQDLGAETPLLDLVGGTASLSGEPLRSRLDPNGVLYFVFADFGNTGVKAVRPHPLPPSWLALDRWDGTLAPGQSTEIALTFSAGTRSVGDVYSASLQVFEAATGAALEVPLAFEVTGVTAAEDEAAPPAGLVLSVFPNPTRGEATSALALPAAAEARLAVYDVLGREVAVLYDGLLPAGDHRFHLDGAALPAGVYLLRAEAAGATVTARVAVVR